MTNWIRRILLLLATSTGVNTFSALSADAGISLANHCEPRLPQ